MANCHVHAVPSSPVLGCKYIYATHFGSLIRPSIYAGKMRTILLGTSRLVLELLTADMGYTESVNGFC